MANKMSLGFVNDTHRSVRESHVRPSRMRVPIQSHTEDGVGVVPVIETKSSATNHGPAPPRPAEGKDAFREPRDTNTFERRLDFLTGQVRELYESLASLQASLRVLEGDTSKSTEHINEAIARSGKLSASLLTIRGECVRDAPQFEDVAGKITKGMSAIPKGTSLVLAYPMIQESEAVLMRRMVVNPHTAAISWTWVKLYEKTMDSETLFVGNFSC